MNNNIINYNIFSLFFKNLKFGTYFVGGRNFSGRICVYHRSGGNKRNFFLIDFFRRINSFGVICKIIKDLHRSAFLGAVLYENGLFSYIILGEGLIVGDFIYSGLLSKVIQNINPGFAIPLYSIAVFSLVNNVEAYPFQGSIYCRSAGSCCVIVGKINDNVIIKFASGWNIYVSKFCISTFGNVSNMFHKFNKLKKAGISRNNGHRPIVRGVAMNPCDHPHGGGEGKKSSPASPRSPWGWLTYNTPSNIKRYQR